jgi:hypothetical protein
MTFRKRILGASAIAWTLAAAGLARGQAATPAPVSEDAEASPRPVAAQMRRLFAARLAADVGLDATQIASVLPRVESLEKSRARWLRERLGLLRELRRGLSSGMNDAELQQRLDALDRVGQETERATRGTLAEIDRELTVPQRVRLRFVMADFRREMAHQVKEFGRGAGGGAGSYRRFRRGELPPAPPSDPTPEEAP